MGSKSISRSEIDPMKRRIKTRRMAVRIILKETFLLDMKKDAILDKELRHYNIRG
jgi:hypothetical protein